MTLNEFLFFTLCSVSIWRRSWLAFAFSFLYLLHMAAGSGWIFAFGGFTLFYGPLLLRLPAAKRI